MQAWETREAKRRWAVNNRDKVQRANRLYRQTFKTRTNAQAAERMRRYRARLKKLRLTPGS